MATTWHECTLADALVAPWSTLLGVALDARGRVVGHPVAWRLWTRMPSRPKAPPVVICTDLAHVTGDRCVAFTDVEATLVLAALTEGGLDAERFVEIARARQVAMAEGRVRPLRWLDVCELAGVDPWGVPRPSTMSLGAALAKLGLEAVRIETLGGVA